MNPLEPNLSSMDVWSDADLVAMCLTGDRDAFGRIVERYQRLLCSLAYSATGSLDESEDLAQEAFLEAWRQIRTLREPAKLRPWLCGILRYKISRARRSDGHEPVRRAEPIEVAEDLPSGDEPTAELAMSHEEQAIVWSALERVPALYREPMVLYYREHCSVEHVAVALDLTEDTVKQRLSRGRKILQEQVLTFVEGALSRSTPGRLFTLGVMAALPMSTTTATAGGVGAAAAQGSLMAKSTGLAGLLSSASGLVSTVLTLRANLDQARTPLERRQVVKITLTMFSGAFCFLATLYLLRAAAFQWSEKRALFAGMTQALVGAAILGWPVAVMGVMRKARVLRSSERQRAPELFLDPRDQVGSSAGEYRSQWTLLGVPLVHARFATADEGDAPVFGWFAGGDRAYGLLCAWGGYAVAPISLGAFAVGGIAIGTLSVGVVSIGTIGVGLISLGCASVGLKAYGWLSACGWETAQGSGFVIARMAADGPIAFAQHANDSVARQILAHSRGDHYQQAFFVLMALVTVIPVACYARAVRRRLGSRGRRETGNIKAA